MMLAELISITLIVDDCDDYGDVDSDDADAGDGGEKCGDNDNVDDGRDELNGVQDDG